MQQFAVTLLYPVPAIFLQGTMHATWSSPTPSTPAAVLCVTVNLFGRGVWIVLSSNDTKSWDYSSI